MTITGHVWPFETVDAGTVYDHPRNVPQQTVGRISFGPGGGADRLERLAVEGDNDNRPLTSNPFNEAFAAVPRAMTGFLAGLSPEQREAALAYRGPDDYAAAPQPLSGFWYLGSPYSLYKDGHDAAASVVAKVAASLMADGVVVYSPIAHGHFVSAHGDLPQTWEFWKSQCQPMIDAAHGLIVLRMEGWQESVGLTYEIGEFERAGKPVSYMSPSAVLAERRVA